MGLGSFGNTRFFFRASAPTQFPRVQRVFRRTVGREPVLSTIAFTLFAAAGASAQTVLSLEEASRRQPGSFAAVHDGERVSLQGTIAAPPVQLREYTHV